ncbi:MAG: hypothetical protein MI748_02600, partial [Opitutales bacterium]|nr:hypothetical protein [Opitutales bacterium]
VVADLSYSSASDVLRNAQFHKQELMEYLQASLEHDRGEDSEEVTAGFLSEYIRQIEASTYLD